MYKNDDMTIGELEKKLKLDSGSIRNPDGTKARSDKKVKILRKELLKIKLQK